MNGTGRERQLHLVTVLNAGIARNHFKFDFLLAKNHFVCDGYQILGASVYVCFVALSGLSFGAFFNSSRNFHSHVKRNC